MTARGRRPGDRGYVAAEFTLGVCVILLPVTMIVLALPVWAERQAMAQRAANESAREMALATSSEGGLAAAERVVTEVAANYDIARADVRGPDLSAGGDVAAGSIVVSRVTVRMPVMVIPLIGRVGSWSWTAVHAERVDDYRSFPGT